MDHQDRRGSGSEGSNSPSEDMSKLKTIGRHWKEKQRERKQWLIKIGEEVEVTTLTLLYTHTFAVRFEN